MMIAELCPNLLQVTASSGSKDVLGAHRRVVELRDVVVLAFYGEEEAERNGLELQWSPGAQCTPKAN